MSEWVKARQGGGRYSYRGPGQDDRAPDLGGGKGRHETPVLACSAISMTEGGAARASLFGGYQIGRRRLPLLSAPSLSTATTSGKDRSRNTTRRRKKRPDTSLKTRVGQWDVVEGEGGGYTDIPLAQIALDRVDSNTHGRHRTKIKEKLVNQG